MDTILSRRRGWRDGSVLLKVILGVSILIAVCLQELSSHRQAENRKDFNLSMVMVKHIKSIHTEGISNSAVPAFLGTKAQDFRTFGTFGALWPPMRAQPEVSVDLFMRRGIQGGPDWAETESPAVVTGYCREEGREYNQYELVYYQLSCVLIG